MLFISAQPMVHYFLVHEEKYGSNDGGRSAVETSRAVSRLRHIRLDVLNLL